MRRLTPPTNGHPGGSAPGSRVGVDSLILVKSELFAIKVVGV